MKVLIIVLCIFMASCTNLIFEKECVVIGISEGKATYKYCYEIDAFPVNQCYYSNQLFNVGDTLRLTK